MIVLAGFEESTVQDLYFYIHVRRPLCEITMRTHQILAYLEVIVSV